MVEDHSEVFDKLMEEDEKDQKKKQPKEIDGLEKVKPSFPPKKAKPVVKIAKAGGLMTASKRADGVAMRGKTKGRMV